MPAPVTIDFTAGGIAGVLRAFDSLDAKAEQVERSVTGRAASGSRTREGGTKREVDVRQKEYEKLVKQLEAQEKAATKAAEREASNRVKAGDAAAKSATKTAERESRNRQKIAVDEARAEERVFAQSLRERERNAKAATRIEEQAAAERVKIAERAASQSEAAARRSSQRLGRAMGSAGLGSIGRTVSGAASLVGGALSVGGGFEVASALREGLTFERAVAQTSNAAFVEGDPRRTRAAADPAKIAALATHVEAGTNIGKTGVANALHKYVNLASDLSGMSEINPETGRSNLEEMGRIAKGSGAEFGDLMTAAGYMKAQNPNMSSGELNLRMRQMVGAGQKGDIAIGDMAKYAELATANAGQFAGDLGTNQAKMLGLTQIAGRVADPAEAAESVNKLAFDVSKHATKMQAAGVSVTDKNGKILDPADLIGNLFAKTGGNIGALSDLGIEARSARVFQGLQRNYDEAEAVKKGSGAEAVRREVSSYEEVNFSQGSADANFSNVMGTEVEKITSVLTHFREVVEGSAMPAFERFVTTLSEHQSDVDLVIQGIGKLASALVEDPVGTAAKIMAAKVAVDVAQAGIGAALKLAIEKALGGGGGGLGGGGLGGPGGSKIGGALGTLGAGAAIGVIAVGATEIGMTAIDAIGGKSDKDQATKVGQGLQAENAVRGVTIDPKTGQPRAMSDQDRVDALKKQLGNLDQDHTLEARSERIDKQITADGGKASPELKAESAHLHEQVESTKRLTRVMEALVAKMHGQGYDPSLVDRPSRSGPLPVPGAGR